MLAAVEAEGEKKKPEEKKKKKSVVPIASGEVNRVVGGLPIPSLNLLEGENDTGKSVFAQDVTWGAILAGFTVRYITTEMTAKALIHQMESLSYHVTSAYLKGTLRVTAFHAKGINWDEELAANYLNVMLKFVAKRGDADVVIFDSLTYIATKASERDLLNFFSEVRNYVDQRGRVVLISIHPYAFDNNMLIRIRSICDGHVVFKVINLPSGEMARCLEVMKLRGATKAANNMVTFKVEPGIGIRVLPFTHVKA